MTRQSFSRMVKVSTASLMTVLFGFPGVAMANQASIRNTGPDSYNKIEFTTKNTCSVENNTDVKASNHVAQNAQTGDATVGGSGWEAYSPEAWQESGHSYEEWESAVNTYLAQNKHDWKNKWDSHGGGNTTGGSATSGNATNTSNNSTAISIDNSDACGFSPNNGSNTPNSSHNSRPGRVLGSASNNKNGSGLGGGGHVLWAGESESSLNGVLGASGSHQSGTSRSSSPTTSGGAGGSGSNGSGSGEGGFSIGNTGPDSYNKISYDESRHTNVSNTNNVFVKNIVTQSASSGNASVSSNTTGGTAGSGGAHNSSGSNTGAGINN